MQDSPSNRPVSQPSPLRFNSDFTIAALLTLLCAVTRWLARPASWWEWDEILFGRALRHFDVTKHAPHPPGFPVFVVMGKLANWLLHDEFRALVAVNFLFASLLAAALFYLYREIFEDRRIAVVGALLCCFFPNVWVYSCAPRSDTPALVLGLIALTLVLRGRVSRRALLAGCALLGVALGVRVTLAAVLGTVTALVWLGWLRRREWRLAVWCVVLVVLGIVSWYVPMVLLHDWQAYRATVAGHGHFLLFDDSFLSPGINGWWSRRLQRFFVDLWGDAWIAWTVYGLSALGLIVLAARKRWAALGWLLAAFVPYLLFTFLLNNPMQPVFYAMPFQPLFAGLMAAGLVLLSERVFAPQRFPRLQYAGVALAIGLTLGLGEWGWWPVKMIHREPSPVFRAITDLRARLAPQRDELRNEILYDPHVNFLMPEYKTQTQETVTLPEPNLLNPAYQTGRTFALTQGPLPFGNSALYQWNAARGRKRVTKMSLERYLKLYLTEITSFWQTNYLDGWYGVENDGANFWRWMGRRAQVALFNEADTMQLSVRGDIVALRDGSHPTLTLRLDGREVARFKPQHEAFEQTLTVPTEAGRFWSVLTLEVDPIVTPKGLGLSNDERELGLRCYEVKWAPLPQAPRQPLTANQFIGEGWDEIEADGGLYWRWMAERGVIKLPPLASDGKLEIELHAAKPDGGQPSRLTLTLSGQVLESFTPPSDKVLKTYRVPLSLHQNRPSALVFTTDQVVEKDGRRFGIQVFRINWKPDDGKPVTP
ncbi:MAG: glycosyltransferase family 39 protein [Acidobacteria bacterium]|nr:glycosyltransferase family 39 protein [Acidobacteriota bacterium]MBI3425322.1 glycosyltransferase family 39 protein [Acidobacteriota bacterium]